VLFLRLLQTDSPDGSTIQAIRLQNIQCRYEKNNDFVSLIREEVVPIFLYHMKDRLSFFYDKKNGW